MRRFTSVHLADLHPGLHRFGRQAIGQRPVGEPQLKGGAQLAA
ncbi:MULTISPECIES: hypothetical protein [unclassified Brenneria]|nr:MULTISPECIES: hypothetical protein [unclassified Brenneria]MDX5630930.1 hypothetical protein [Brenneria sp. L3-3Z]